MKNLNLENQRGFTIMELVIATSVFGVMLLLATTGMIQIGLAYYKGITTSKTQEITTGVAEDITNSIQLGGNIPISQSTPTLVSGFDMAAICLGNIRYSYVLNVKVADTNNPGPAGEKTIKHALWLDVIKPGTTTCPAADLSQAQPSDVNTDTVASSSQARDLLGSSMRLSKFTVTETGLGANVDVRVVYGDDDVLDVSSGDPAKYTCLPNRSGGHFCAFSELDSYVKKRQ